VIRGSSWLCRSVLVVDGLVYCGMSVLFVPSSRLQRADNVHDVDDDQYADDDDVVNSIQKCFTAKTPQNEQPRVSIRIGGSGRRS